MENIFKADTTQKLISRINGLTPDSKAKWGLMTVSQMLAHCSVTYELVYDNKHAKPNFFLKLFLKIFVKNAVTSEKAYKESLQTAPYFMVVDDRDFEKEKNRLVAFLNKTCEHGESFFNGKESHSFGALNSTEWNNMFYKHLDHHLKQFGV